MDTMPERKIREVARGVTGIELTNGVNLALVSPKKPPLPDHELHKRTCAFVREKLSLDCELANIGQKKSSLESMLKDASPDDKAKEPRKEELAKLAGMQRMLLGQKKELLLREQNPILKFAKENRLMEMDYALLEMIGADLRSHVEIWLENAGRCMKFISDNGRKPSRSPEKSESFLASWYYANLARLKKGKLNDAQIGKMGEIKQMLSDLGAG